MDDTPTRATSTIPAYYIGACLQVCNQTIDNAWSEYSALGYSGTNSGGRLIVKNSEFDNNKDGFDTNSQNNDDPPSPQNGACARNGKISPITHTHSCWVFIHNYVHDNNNPNVPRPGAASEGPTGTGNDDRGRAHRHGHGQRVRRTTARGASCSSPTRTTRRRRPARPARAARRHSSPGFGCILRRLGQPALRQHVLQQRLLREPDEQRLRRDHALERQPDQLLPGQQAPDGSSPPTLQQTNGKCGQTGTADPNPELTREALCNTRAPATAPACRPTTIRA